MTDQNLSEKSELTTPLTTDLVYVLNDPAGTPADKKVQLLNLHKALYVERHIEVRLVASGTDVIVASTIGGDFRLPSAAGTITDCGAYVDTAGVTGTMTVDIHLATTTIMTTNKISIATAQKSSEDGSATQPVLTTTAYTANAILTFDVDAIQTTAAKGLTVWLDLLETP